MSEQPAGTTCAAFGCPMPGAFRGFGLGEGWWCFIHASGACDLQATTARINAHAHPLKVMLKASNMAAHQWANASNQRYIADVMTRHGRVDLLPTAEEREKSARSWAARARAVLRDACFVRERDDLATQAEARGQFNDVQPIREFFSGFADASSIG